MYLTPRRKIVDEEWYMTTPMGKNTLGKICKDMFQKAGISGRFTNHSARRTAVSTLLGKNVHETKVQQLSGHKNIQSLNEYRVATLEQQKSMSNILTKAISDAKASNDIPDVDDQDLLDALEIIEKAANGNVTVSPVQLHDQGAQLPSEHEVVQQIGRASCRERV